MTTQQKQDYLRAFRKFQKAREVYYKPKIKALLTKQALQVVHKEVVTFEPIYTLLLSLYKDVAKVWGHQSHLSIRRQVAKSRQPIGFSERLYNILKDQYGIDLLKDAMNITQTTKDIIQKILTDAAITGIGIDDIVKEITDNDFPEVRARRIARTETVAAANIAGDIIAKESGLEMNKEWLAILDQRTRPDHYAIHGTIIEQDLKFDVNGNPMRFPGDRGTDGIDTPPGETINCRCVAVYIPKRDAHGRLL